MSDKIASTDEIRMLAHAASTANRTHSNTAAAIDVLVETVEALCDALDHHQHGYYAPSGLNGKWLNTVAEAR